MTAIGTPPRPDALPEPLVRPVMPELDSLRGMAVLGVLLLHGFEWQYGWENFHGMARVFLRLTQPGGLGVNLFFVLSGFLITGILIDAKGKPQYYRRFYTRRALRILPAYYALLILLLVFRSSSFSFVELSFVYLANLTSFFGVACDYGPLWSLAVEEHYYIFWPAVVGRITSRGLTIVSLVICIVVPAMRAFSFHLGWVAGLGWYTWFVADGLALGSLLAIVLRSSITRKQVASLGGGLLGGALLLGIVGEPFGIQTRNRLVGAALQYTLIHAFFGGVLLLFLLVGSSSRKGYVNYRWLRFLGYISYGLYLIHLLVFRMYDKLGGYYWPNLLPTKDRFDLVLLRFIVASGFAIAVASISRMYFEELFLRLKDRMVPAASLAAIGPAAPAQP